MSTEEQVKAKILSLEPVGAYFHLKLQAPEIAASVEPGHFVAIAVGGHTGQYGNTIGIVIGWCIDSI